mmetsp:Transcript_83553/g.147737  ORF Transcript_83553/g.147737 Transcript_83553/m.147737 type:complete len:237 (+) Transcript_83553:1030-1740(+)
MVVLPAQSKALVSSARAARTMICAQTLPRKNVSPRRWTSKMVSVRITTSSASSWTAAGCSHGWARACAREKTCSEERARANGIKSQLLRLSTLESLAMAAVLAPSRALDSNANPAQIMTSARAAMPRRHTSMAQPLLITSSSASTSRSMASMAQWHGMVMARATSKECARARARANGRKSHGNPERKSNRKLQRTSARLCLSLWRLLMAAACRSDGCVVKTLTGWPWALPTSTTSK